MKYQSTRNRALTASPAEAVLAGIAPDGGLFIWCTMPDGSDSMKFCAIASKRLVAAVPGASFAADEHEISPSFRLNFSLPTEEQIYAGMKILGEAADEYLTVRD